MNIRQLAILKMSPSVENKLSGKEERRSLKKLRKMMDSLVYRLGEKANAFILKEEKNKPSTLDMDPVEPLKKLRSWVKWGPLRRKCFDNLSLFRRDQTTIALEYVIEMRHKVCHGSLSAIKAYHLEYLTSALIVAKLLKSRSTKRKADWILKRLNRSKLDRLPEFVDFKYRIPKKEASKMFELKK